MKESRKHNHWVKKSDQEIKSQIFNALNENINYQSQHILGIPASYLDNKVFNQDATFLKDAPFISTLVQNPNHIGCHTLGKSESFFSGTQQIEKEIIDICARDILACSENDYDGYIASGGTESNIQAIWIYRNFFRESQSAKDHEICILCTEDSHYSMDKAANLLNIDIIKVPVDFDKRSFSSDKVLKIISKATKNKKKYIIAVANMMTTMYGSVDDVDQLTNALIKSNCHFKLHIDAAYGGFYYPFSSNDSSLTFKNKHITSFTLDAHKMAQAPYGTGIFIIRKGLIQNANTKEATYVEGEDYTLIGSRSGANAVAVWMILSKNGPHGWHEKSFILQKRTQWLCNQLDELDIKFYRHPASNIVAIHSNFIFPKIAKQFGLVPDNHLQPNWFKVIIMEHVTIEKLELLVNEVKISLLHESNHLSDNKVIS